MKKITLKIKDLENLILNKVKIIEDQPLKRNLIIKNHFLKNQVIRVKKIILKINLKKIIHRMILILIQKLVFLEKKQIIKVQLKKIHQLEGRKILAMGMHKRLIPLGKEENKELLNN